ncbi:MAG: class I SAM-dependent methyltransferase, partial [Lentisphaerae bacterium]|nr:class I SAM-dependent methyltransferase [Lentisphaerota bacterium]
DAGCGTGHWSMFFAQRGFDVTGVDLSPAMIAMARARHAPHCRFITANLLNLPFPDGTFDVACIITALEFTTDATRACAEMWRCLKPGGRLLVGTLNRLAALNRKRRAAVKGPFAKARLFDQESLRSLLATCGDAVIRVTQENQSGRTAPSGARAHANGAMLVAKVDKP